MAEKLPKPPTELTFDFELDPNYRIIASNGIWGGITSRGDMRLDFFVESQAIPRSVTNQIENGRIGKETKRIPASSKIVRKMQVGILLTPEHAESVADFIKEKLTAFRKAQDGE